MVLLYLVYNLVRKNTALLDIINLRDNWILEFYNRIQFMNSEIKAIDSRGHFEADDEVGFFFKELKRLITMLSDLIVVDDQPNKKT